MARKDQDFRDLCEYVRKDVLGYNDDMKLPTKFILRLQGLRKGQFVANNRIEPLANYSCEDILLTFKLKSFDIKTALSTKTFNSENHKFNYIMAIVESSINDVVLKKINTDKVSEKIQVFNVNIEEEPKAEYKKKTKSKKIDLDSWC